MSNGFLLAADNVGAHTVTADRVVATVAALVTLAAAIVGGLAVARPDRVGRRGSTAAIAAGIVGAIVGVLLLATADGGPGTGNGVVGAAAAVILGLAAAALGWLALARAHRTA